MIYRRITGALAALTLAGFGVLLAAGPAQAEATHTPAAPWAALDAIGPVYPFDRAPAELTIVESPTSVLLQVDVTKPGGTSVETPDLGLDVAAGAVVTFRYELLDGAACGSGAPRVFFYDHAGADTMLEATWINSAAAPEPCGVDGVVTFEIPVDARIGTAGVVYDSGAGGKVRVSDLTVDGVLILFGSYPVPPEPCEWDDSLSSDDPDCVKPSPKPTVEPTVEPSDPPGVGGGADEQLPATGASWLPLAVVGAVALVAGVALLGALRRRSRPVFTLPTG